MFNWLKKEHGPSSARLKKERKKVEGCGRWGTQAVVREVAEETIVLLCSLCN